MLKKTIVSALLFSSLLGGITAFATENTSQQTTANGANKNEIRSIIEELETQLSEYGIETPDKNKQTKKLDLTDEQQEALDAIKEKVKNDEITKDEAKTQIEELGITLPEKSNKKQKNSKQKLTTEQQEAVNAIKAQVENDEITKDEAKAQMAELGIKQKEKMDRLEKISTQIEESEELSEEEKAQAKALIEEAQAKINQLSN